MTQTADHMQQYLDHFARFEKSLNGQTDAAVHALRRDAIAEFTLHPHHVSLPSAITT